MWLILLIATPSLAQQYEYYDQYTDYTDYQQQPVQSPVLKERVPLECVSCRSQALTTRPPQQLDSVILGTQEALGQDGRDKVKVTPQNTRRGQVAINNAIKDAQEVLGGTEIDDTRELTKVKSTKGRVGISGVLRSAQESIGDDGRDGFASEPARGFITTPSRTRVSLSGTLRSSQSTLKTGGHKNVVKQERRKLTKIDPKKRQSALQAVRLSQGSSLPSEDGEGEAVTGRTRRPLTRLQVGRTKISDGHNLRTNTKTIPRTRTRVRMKDAASLRRKENTESQPPTL